MELPREPHLGRRRPTYTDSEKLRWVQRAWTELGEPFTATAYKRWQRKKTAETGTSIPALARSTGTFGGWKRARELALPGVPPVFEPKDSARDRTRTDPRLVPLRTMIALLPAQATAEVRRALHSRLNAPPTAAESRVEELRFLTLLLEEQPQQPGRLPAVPRKLYDARRAAHRGKAPPSARLQQKFGSWSRACNAAWGLHEDGRSWGPGEPWARPGATRRITHERKLSRASGVAPLRSAESHRVTITTGG